MINGAVAPSPPQEHTRQRPTFPNIDFIHEKKHHQGDSHTSTSTMTSWFVILVLPKVAFFLATFSLRKTSPRKTTSLSIQRASYLNLTKVPEARELAAPLKNKVCQSRFEAWVTLTKCLGRFFCLVWLIGTHKTGGLRLKVVYISWSPKSLVCFKVGPKRGCQGWVFRNSKVKQFWGWFLGGSPDVWESRRVLTDLARDRTKDSSVSSSYVFMFTFQTSICE